jgi:hypothetical protein
MLPRVCGGPLGGSAGPQCICRLVTRYFGRTGGAVSIDRHSDVTRCDGKPALQGISLACASLLDVHTAGTLDQRLEPGSVLRRTLCRRGFPGETRRASIWKDNDKLVSTVIAPSRDNAAVLCGVEPSRLSAFATPR